MVADGTIKQPNPAAIFGPAQTQLLNLAVGTTSVTLWTAAGIR
jgi:hypothetical protein